MTEKKNPHAAALGKLGGQARMKGLSPAAKTKLSKKGGIARAKKLSAAELSQIGTLAVRARERQRAARKQASQ